MTLPTPASESEPGLPGVLAAYQRIVTEYPGSEIAARSLLRMAALQYGRFFNVDAAQENLTTLIENYGNSVGVVLEAKILLTDVLIAINKLDDAEHLLQELTSARFLSADQQQTVAYGTAQLAYFKGNFQQSLEKLDPLSKQVMIDAANDAIGLQIFIQEHQKENEALLKDYSRAELLVKQRKLSEALALFQSILQSSPASSLQEYASISIGDLQARMHRFTEAVSAYERLQKSFPESILLDKALMRSGRVYEVCLHENEKAIAAYQKLLETYPQSLFVNEARKRIRELRGDTL